MIDFLSAEYSRDSLLGYDSVLKVLDWSTGSSDSFVVKVFP